MIYPIQMYACKCDGCGKEWDNGDSIVALIDKESLKYSVECSDWQVTKEGNTYCPKCWYVDDEDNIAFKEMKK